MKKYKVIFKGKTPVNNAGEVSDFRLVTVTRHVRASSFHEAREKIRKSYKYEIVQMSIMEARKSWIMRMIKKLLKR